MKNIFLFDDLAYTYFFAHILSKFSKIYCNELRPFFYYFSIKDDI
jgi:hypothetical protein